MNDQKRRAPTPHNMCAIVVTYHPDEGLPERIERIFGQVDKVVIVDNHSSETCLAMIKKISAHLEVHLILNDENLGIATALNQGVRYAIDCGYTWALTLDQDTVPCQTMIQNLISAYHDCPFKEKVGVIGSNYQERVTGRVALHENDYEKNSWLEVKEVITSGSLMSIPIFEKTGFFRDDFFIDLVDFEYCLRLKTSGYKVIITRGIGMVHSHGDCIIRKFLFRNIVLHDYPPLRSYYRMRNGLLLVREYLWKETGWALPRLHFLIRRFVSTILLEDNKVQKLNYICLGIYHALISKAGKLGE